MILNVKTRKQEKAYIVLGLSLRLKSTTNFRAPHQLEIKVSGKIQWNSGRVTISKEF